MNTLFASESRSNITSSPDVDPNLAPYTNSDPEPFADPNINPHTDGHMRQ